MDIILRNGKKIRLEWSTLIFEYLEEYKGGIKALYDDLDNENMMMYACNHYIYSIIAANCEEELTYRQAVSLVNIEDVTKVIDFAFENSIKTEKSIQNEIGEKVTSYKSHHK